MKAVIALALLFGTTAAARLQWITETSIDEFDDSVSVDARVKKGTHTGISVKCDDGDKLLSVSIGQSKRMQPSFSEEIAVRFDDEAPETLSVVIEDREFILLGNWFKEHHSDPVELAKKLTNHGKFRLRYFIRLRRLDYGVDNDVGRYITLVFEYDKDSANEAIGKVLEHCGIT